MDPTTVLFAIEAGVKLGRKLHDVLIDNTLERSMFLPVGDVLGIQFAEAQEFFDREENRHLVKAGGPYHDISNDDELEAAYLAIVGINERLGDGKAFTDEAAEIVYNLHKFEQFKEGFGAHPAVQRLLGTVVEIGIDYFIANPQALGRNSSARQLVGAFLAGLDETDFAEGELADIAGDVLVAGLKVFGENTSLVSGDQRVQVILGGMTQALIDDFKEAETEGAKDRRRHFFERITANMLRGAADAVAENAELFIRGDDASKQIIRSTITQLFRGLKGKEELLTNESLELLVKSALGAVSENAELISDQPIIQEIIERSVEALTSAKSGQLFSEASIAAILRSGLETLSENIETLIDPNDPERRFIADAVAAIASGLASNLGSGSFRDVLSTKQLIELAQIVFNEVARHPEHLLGESMDEPAKTALAQIISSVASSLGEDPSRLISGQGALDLLKSALKIAIQNADKLLDLDSEDPTTNLLYKVLSQFATAVVETDDPRKLLTREAFLETAKRILATVSADLDLILADGPELLRDVVAVAMELTHGDLENRINGANLPILIEGLLREVLRKQLRLDDAGAIIAAANAALNAA